LGEFLAKYWGAFLERGNGFAFGLILSNGKRDSPSTAEVFRAVFKVDNEWR